MIPAANKSTHSTPSAPIQKNKKVRFASFTSSKNQDSNRAKNLLTDARRKYDKAAQNLRIVGDRVDFELDEKNGNHDTVSAYQDAQAIFKTAKEKLNEALNLKRSIGVDNGAISSSKKYFVEKNIYIGAWDQVSIEDLKELINKLLVKDNSIHISPINGEEKELRLFQTDLQTNPKKYFKDKKSVNAFLNYYEHENGYDHNERYDSFPDFEQFFFRYTDKNLSTAEKKRISSLDLNIFEAKINDKNTDSIKENCRQLKIEFPNLGKIIDAYLKSNQEKYSDFIIKCGSTGFSMAKHFENIKKIMLLCKKENISSGYFIPKSTNNKNNPFSSAADARQHVDACIITPRGQILIMVPYYNIQDYLHDNFKGEVFSPDLGNYINEKIDALPQSARSLTGCESLGLSSMKVYLKKNSKQLKSHTLLVKNSTGKTLLIPTPQALRYSESLLYIEIFHKLVANKNKSVTIEHTRDNKAISIQSPTLLGMLEDPNTSIEMVDGTKILNKTQLSKFRKLWIKEYQVSMEKRSAMDIAFHNGIRNRYLQYKEWKNIKYVNRSTLSSQIDACTISDR